MNLRTSTTPALAEVGSTSTDAYGSDLVPAVHIADSEDHPQPRPGLRTRSRQPAVRALQGREFEGDGGGVFLDDIRGNALIERTTISYNEAGTPGRGRAVQLWSTKAPAGGIIFGQIGDVTITGTTISGNRSNKYGGGIFLHGSYGDNGFLMENSTLSGNEVLYGDGGGAFLRNENDGGPAEFVFRNTTITDNDVIGEGSEGGGLFARVLRRGHDALERDRRREQHLITARISIPRTDAESETGFHPSTIRSSATSTTRSRSTTATTRSATTALPPIDPPIAPIAQQRRSDPHPPAAGGLPGARCRDLQRPDHRPAWRAADLRHPRDRKRLRRNRHRLGRDPGRAPATPGAADRTL